MATAFDQRIVRVGIEIDGKISTFEGLDIRSRGRKFASSLPAQCDITISNLTREQRNFILTHATPLIVKGKGTAPGPQRTPVEVTLDVGRESYGAFRLYEGNSFACGATQPPDIGIVLQSLTQNINAALAGAWTQSGVRPLSVISKAVADSMNPPLALDFQATDKNIDNYSFTGAALSQVEKLNQMGGTQSWIDNKKLVVVDSDKPIKGATRLINLSTGMIGVPQVTDTGVLVRVLVDNSIQVGCSVEIQSKINPAVNGTFKVCRMEWDIANRREPFYYNLFCSNLVFVQGDTT